MRGTSLAAWRVVRVPSERSNAERRGSVYTLPRHPTLWSDAASDAASDRATRRSARAFTLIELMVVVILIGILTVMAIPTMAEAHYNARTLDDATQIAELYREGRTRAVGRGAAMLVQMVSANTMGGVGTELGTFSLYEAQVPPGAGAASLLNALPGGSPLSSCGNALTNWATLTTTNSATSLIDIVTLNTLAEQQGQIWTILNDGTGVAPTQGSLCFTPLGRSYYQPTVNPAPVFTPGVNLLHGNLQISVQRSGIGGPVTGVTRTVIVPDSGATRIVSR